MLTTLFLLYALTLILVRWRKPERLADAMMPGLFALLTITFFWRLVSGDAFMPADGGDLGSFLYPTYHFIQQSLKEGVWPLWNPHIYSGVPFAAEIQSGIFYPPHLLRFLLGPEITYRDMEGLVLAHIWWAGFTTYLLARGIKLNRYAAVLAGVAFMFSDLFILHFGNLNLIGVTAWLPLVLLGVHRYLEEGSIRWALGAGLALGLGSLIGHIQMTMFGMMAIGLWAGFWLLTDLSVWRQQWRRTMLAILLPSLIAIGIMAPMLLPGMEIAAFTERSEWRYAQTVGFSLSPAQLIGLLIPGFFGRSPALHWGLWPRVEVGYIGVFTLVLALVGMILRRDRLTWLLIAIGAVALAFSLGIYSIVHGWFTWLLPGLEQLRAPARFIFLLDLSLALLAGRGLQTMMRSWTPEERGLLRGIWALLRNCFLIALAIGVPLIYAVLLLTRDGDPGLHLRASVSTIAVMHFLLLFAASLGLFFARKQAWMRGETFAFLAIALIFLDLASLGAYNDISEKDPTTNFNRTAILEFLQSDPELYRIDARTDIDQLWQPDTAMVHQLYDVWGVANPLSLEYYNRYWNSVGSRSTDKYALLNVKYLLGKKDVVLDQEVWELAFDRDPDLNVYRNRRFQPRVHLLGHARVAPDDETAWAWLQDPSFRPLSEVIIVGGSPMAEEDGLAEIIAWETNQVLIHTQSKTQATLLIAQTWYPGWEASLDGGPWQPVLRADGAFQAVQVPAGEHEVRLRFRSSRQTLGLALMVLTLLLVGAVWWYSGKANRPQKPSTS